jgi:alpha-1,2-mannosyltransferase
VAELRALATALGLDGCARIEVNVSYDERLGWMRRAACGLHTMWMEHFGIGVVELMAAGVVPIAHRSGGPLADIVVPAGGVASGRLASSVDEYAAAMHELLVLVAQPGRARFVELQRAAREAASRFSDVAFCEAFCAAIAPLLSHDSRLV